jgi:hypothetical protein
VINQILPHVSEFAAWRSSFPTAKSTNIKGLTIANSERVMAEFSETLDSLQALQWYQQLMNTPVSKFSLFGDILWDFNADEPHAARNIKGSPLRLDFSRFPNLNPIIQLEMKLAFMSNLKLKSLVDYGSSGKRPSKPHTVITNFVSGLRFVDDLCKRVKALDGDEYFVSSFEGFRGIDASVYSEVAAKFEYTFCKQIRNFFKVIRSPFLSDNVFGGALPFVNLSMLKWPKVEGKGLQRDSVLSNEIFEKLSREASFTLVDFLEKLDEPVQDAEALRRKSSQLFCMADRYNLTSRNFDIFVAIRLGGRGYSTVDIIESMRLPFDDLLSDRVGFQLKNRRTLKEMTGGVVNGAFNDYMAFVSDCACYIVGQYTGMRPSELSEIMLGTCIQPDGEYHVLVSNVKKHQENNTALFDDKWVAIPIVRDAIRAAQLISTYTKNPYLFLGNKTVKNGESFGSFTSSSMSYRLNVFVSKALTPDEIKSIEIYPYVLRHTLANQMWRIEIGMPYISHQLKHFGELVGRVGQNKSFSETSLGYGMIGDILSTAGLKGNGNPRFLAERERAANYADPDGSFAGPNAETHRVRLRRIFEGYMAHGYTKDQIFDEMARQKLAIIDVGQGFCYGGKREDFDESLPCIGSLRCNPNRCSNSVITKANAVKWREVYFRNRDALTLPEAEGTAEELREAMEEAKSVLIYLGEEID